MLLELLAQREVGHRLRLFVKSWNVRRRRWNFVAEQGFQNPAPSQDGTRPQRIRGQRVHRRHSDDTAAVSAGQFHPLEVVARDPLYAVDVGKTFVDESI